MASRLPALRPLIARRIAIPILHAWVPRRTYATKPSNPTREFYKTFTRPVAKVLLGAILTYQLIYFGWMALETEEIKAQADATIEELEGKVDEYKKKMAAEAKPEKSS